METFLRDPLSVMSSQLLVSAFSASIVILCVLLSVSLLKHDMSYLDLGELVSEFVAYQQLLF